MYVCAYDCRSSLQQRSREWLSLHDTIDNRNSIQTMTEPAYTFRQSDLPKLDLHIDRWTDFGAWRTQWESYCSLSGLGGEAAMKQVKALTLCFSRETLSIVQNLGLTEDQMKDKGAIIDAMQKYVDGHIKETVERRNFQRRTQQPGESFDDYLISLCELAKTCKFCSESCMQKGIRDQVIEGLSDGDTVEALLQESDLTLATTIARCRSKEAAKKHRTDISTRNTDMVAALRKPHLYRHNQINHHPAQGVWRNVPQGRPQPVSSL